MFSSKQLAPDGPKSTPFSDQIVSFLNRTATLKGWNFSCSSTPATLESNARKLKLTLHSKIDSVTPVETTITVKKQASEDEATYRDTDRNPFPSLPDRLPSGKEFILYDSISVSQTATSTSDELPIELFNNILKQTVLLSLKSAHSYPTLSYLLMANLCLPRDRQNEAPIEKYIKVYNAISLISKSFPTLNNPNFSCNAFSALYQQIPPPRSSTSGTTYRKIYKRMLEKIHSDINRILTKLKSPHRGLEIPKEIQAFLNRTELTTPGIENVIIQYLDDLFLRATAFLSHLDQALSIQALKKQLLGLSKMPSNSLATQSDLKFLDPAVKPQDDDVGKSADTVAQQIEAASLKQYQEIEKQFATLNEQNALLTKQVHSLQQKYQQHSPATPKPRTRSPRQLSSQLVTLALVDQQIKTALLSTSKQQQETSSQIISLKKQNALLAEQNSNLKQQLNALAEKNKLLDQQNTALSKKPTQKAPAFTEAETAILQMIAKNVISINNPGTPPKSLNASLASLLGSPGLNGTPRTFSILDPSLFSNSTATPKGRQPPSSQKS